MTTIICILKEENRILMRKLDMKSRLITVIPGDGIGPSIVKATIKVHR